MELNWTFILCSAAVIGAGAAVIPQILKRTRKSDEDSPLILFADETENDESLKDASAVYSLFIKDCKNKASHVLKEQSVDCIKAILSLKKSKGSLIECCLYRRLKSGKIIKTVISGDSNIYVDDCPQEVQEKLLSGEYIIKL